MEPKYKLRKRIIDGFWDLFVLIKYPKLALLACTVFLAYITFRTDTVQAFFHSLREFGYLSAFLGGALFAFGFGAPFGIAILGTIANDVNIYLAAVIGGSGALMSDFILFKFIRVTFNDEIERFKDSKAFNLFNGMLLRRIPPKISFYILLGVAGIVIASPLPDEFGVAMLAGIITISNRTFALAAFSLNTLGILIVLGIGQTI